ncbi:hypothetical protein NIES2109_55600 (plasmid) [Nostoc sp. HK-01]|nr:hypothetical protein NIES2109_55600 [Nostoc sp. HK-01]
MGKIWKKLRLVVINPTESLASVIIPGLSTEQRIDYGIQGLTTTGTIFAGIAVLINSFYVSMGLFRIFS